MSTRRSAALALIVLLILLCVLPTSAQQLASDADYPTVDALNDAVIPPRDRVELAERLRGLRVTDIPATPAAPPTHQLGDKQVFNVVNSSDNTSFRVPATLRVIGDHIYLWVEVGADVNLSDLQGLAHDFDTQIYPNVRALWGSELNPGVDGDPHVYGVFAHGLGASTAAYFASDHTYPKEVVPASNEHEMFFFNLDTMPSDFPLHPVESIVAHEFQHMIRFNLQINTETWLNEGLSVFTQYYLYGDLDYSILDFLNTPNTQLNDWNVDPGLRSVNYGAASMFLTYFYERYGIDAMRTLSAEHLPRGLQDVDATLQSLSQPGANDFFGDWALANDLDDSTYMGGKYGYPELPALPAPSSEATASRYPFRYQGSANQYAATYIVLPNASSVSAFTLHLDSPASVGLVPTTASSGTHFWYSNRGDMGDTRLTHRFDLSGVSHAALDYRFWYQTEQSWDYGYVMVSDDDGASWHILSTPHTITDDPHGVTYGAGYTGDSGGWISESLPLDAYAGKQILVRFEMITDDAVTRPGLALDDVSIPEIGYSDDFEQNDGGWQPEGWVWTDNRLPEQGWLQVMQKAGSQTVDVTRWSFDNADHQIEVAPGVDQVVLAISPFAPVTTVAMPYTLMVDTAP